MGFISLLPQKYEMLEDFDDEIEISSLKGKVVTQEFKDVNVSKTPYRYLEAYRNSKNFGDSD